MRERQRAGPRQIIRGYVAFNPGDAPRTVTFSDGTKLQVPPKQLVTKEPDLRAPADE